MERDAVEQVEFEFRMGFFVRTHAFEETFHPELSIRVRWTYTYAVELANLWAKHLDRRVILVHLQGKLDKVVNIFCDREWLSCIWIIKPIWFVAHRPEFDRMEGDIGIFACTQLAPGIVHVVHPATRQVRPGYR